MKVLLSILLILLSYDQVANGYRILGVFPLNGKSHWVMMEQLMKGLAKRGHQVDVITHFPQKTPIPNYTDISIFGSAPQAVNNVTAEDIKGFGSFSMKRFTELVGDRICELMKLPQVTEVIKNPPKNPPYDLVIIELFGAPCLMGFGRHLNVPMVATVSSVFQDWLYDVTGNPHNSAFVPSLFSTYSQNMTFMQRVINTLQIHVVSAQINYYTSFQNKYVKDIFGIDIPSVFDLYQDLSLLLVNSHFTLHGIKPSTPAVIDVAGIHISEDGDPLSPEVKKWLDESKHGCVFFTFGSMVRIETFPKETVQEFYKAFEKIAPVRVLMKIAKKEELLPGLPKNVMTQSWFPQIAVLKHNNTKAFITHGGLMGTLESIYCGVPMVGIPLFGDQHTNIMNYVNKKVAVSLGSVNNVTADKLYEAINTVLQDKSYRTNVKKLQEIYVDRPLTPMETAIYWVEYVAKYGNVLQSPAIRLSWIQKNLIDVYAFFILCLIAVLSVLYFVLKMVKCLLFGSKSCAKKQSKATATKKNK